MRSGGVATEHTEHRETNLRNFLLPPPSVCSVYSVVKRKFNDRPFPYHHELELEITTLTNLGVGLGRVPLPSIENRAGRKLGRHGAVHPARRARAGPRLPQPQELLRSRCRRGADAGRRTASSRRARSSAAAAAASTSTSPTPSSSRGNAGRWRSSWSTWPASRFPSRRSSARRGNSATAPRSPRTSTPRGRTLLPIGFLRQGTRFDIVDVRAAPSRPTPSTSASRPRAGAALAQARIHARRHPPAARGQRCESPPTTTPSSRETVGPGEAPPAPPSSPGISSRTTRSFSRRSPATCAPRPPPAAPGISWTPTAAAACSRSAPPPRSPRSRASSSASPPSASPARTPPPTASPTPVLRRRRRRGSSPGSTRPRRRHRRHHRSAAQGLRRVLPRPAFRLRSARRGLRVLRPRHANARPARASSPRATR
jgi:hypothetical protein